MCVCVCENFHIVIHGVNEEEKNKLLTRPTKKKRREVIMEKDEINLYMNLDNLIFPIFSRFV